MVQYFKPIFVYINIQIFLIYYYNNHLQKLNVYIKYYVTPTSYLNIVANCILFIIAVDANKYSLRYNMTSFVFSAFVHDYLKNRSTTSWAINTKSFDKNLKNVTSKTYKNVVPSFVNQISQLSTITLVATK